MAAGANLDWRVALVDSTGVDAMDTTLHAMKVEGAQVTGAVLTENPVLICGQNAGNAKLFALDSGGNLGVISGATLTVGGTAAVGAGQSGNPLPIGVIDVNGNMQMLGTAARIAGTNGLGSFAPLAAGMLAYDGANLQYVRSPNVFKTVSATASGNTALWTPAAGKKFRLLKYMVIVTGNAVAAAAAGLVVDLVETGTSPGVLNQTHFAFIGTTAAGTANLQNVYVSPWVDLGNGYLCSTINNVLNINLSFALTGGIVRVIAVGNEE